MSDLKHSDSRNQELLDQILQKPSFIRQIIDIFILANLNILSKSIKFLLSWVFIIIGLLLGFLVSSLYQIEWFLFILMFPFLNLTCAVLIVVRNIIPIILLKHLVMLLTYLLIGTFYGYTMSCTLRLFGID